MRGTAVVLLLLGQCLGATPVTKGMKSFGSAVKQARLQAGTEKTVFEHALAPEATHGAITQQWHAGMGNQELRVRIYIDSEAVASVDYLVDMAHGAGPAQINIEPNSSDPMAAAWSAGGSFGRTHESGFWNTYLVPFQQHVKVTLTNDHDVAFWYMVRGMENMPLVVSGLELPVATARLKVIRTTATVAANSLVILANVSGSAGLFRQLNLIVNSTNYLYQEGCVSATVDASDHIWLSSGLEDYFLAAYFHSTTTQHLPWSGFELGATSELDPVTTKKPDRSNSLAAYRIHEKDPILFTDSLEFYWVASSDNAHKEDGWCNYDWPAAPKPAAPSTPEPSEGNVAVDALAWVYTW